MWHISTSFACGTEDREVGNTFKVLLLNLASEKHISKLHGVIQAEAVVGTFYIHCILLAFSLTACSNCQLYTLGEGVVVMCSLHMYVHSLPVCTLLL